LGAPTYHQFVMLLPELQTYVLSFLTQKQLISISAVSKHFKKSIYGTPTHWTNLNIYPAWRNLISKKQLKALIRNVGMHVKQINLFCCYKQVDDETLSFIAQNCHHLTSLNLRFCGKITDEGFDALCNSQCATRLKSLKLTFCLSLHSLSNFTNLSSLETLDIMFTSIPTDDFEYLKSLKNLHTLHYLGIRVQQDKSDIIKKELPQVKNSYSVKTNANFLEGIQKEKEITFDRRYTEWATKVSELKKKQKIFRQGEHCYTQHDLRAAIDAYEKSIAVFPTADAHTYLGWMYSLSGIKGDMIQECYKAIQVDPEFGNPYNDLGCYFSDLGQEVAVKWFERAKLCNRYECRHFPHVNLARYYEENGKDEDAIVEYCLALLYAPWDISLLHRVMVYYQNIITIKATCFWT